MTTDAEIETLVERLTVHPKGMEWGDFVDVMEDAASALTSIQSDRDRLAQRLADVGEVLKPFADKAAKFDGTWIDDREHPYADSGYAYDVHFSVGQLRRARQFLAGEQG